MPMLGLSMEWRARLGAEPVATTLAQLLNEAGDHMLRLFTRFINEMACPCPLPPFAGVPPKDNPSTS